MSWPVKLLPKGKVELCVTYAEPEPAVCTDTANGALALDLNTDHIAGTLVNGDGRLLDAWRWDLRDGNDNIQNATRLMSLMAATRGVPVVAEDLDFRKKKSWLKQYGKRFRSVLSLFRTRQLLSALERQCRRRGVELIGVEHADTEEVSVPRPVLDWNTSCCGARHRAPWLGICRACAEDGLAPRLRRSEATGYAGLGEHARAVAAPRMAYGRSAWRQQQAGGSRGPRRGSDCIACPA